MRRQRLFDCADALQSARIAACLDSPRRPAFNQRGVFHHCPAQDDPD